jgi:1-deoxy-D-xylulose-5-phosphate reductoisomerase
MDKKKVIILGCTGSIGQNTIDIIDAMPDSFEIAALSANTREAELLKLSDKFNVKKLALTGKSPSSEKIQYSGKDALIRLISETEADIVVNGVAGSEGLKPSIISLETGKDLALANKETIVMAGGLINSLAEEKSRNIIPVDSEHSAIFHLIKGQKKEQVSEIIITASGGAFRDLTKEDLGNVTLEDALKHPNWSMGQKITIDSASMANKGLEVIEAFQLFNIDLENIKVLIHPQSMVHSLIRTREGSLYAQISKPDMRIPIQNALTYPDLGPALYGSLDLDNLSLDFRKPDFDKYRMLYLAYESAKNGDGYNIAYNAANEIAVDAFTKKKIRFIDIPVITEKTLSRGWKNRITSFDEIFETDLKAREIADEITSELK